MNDIEKHKLATSILKRRFPKDTEGYTPMYYPLMYKYAWINDKTGLPLDRDHRGEYLNRVLTSFMFFIDTISWYIENKYMTKEDILKFFNEDSGQ